MSKPTIPSAEELREKSVSSLSDKPNSPSRYGEGGMTAKELKARYDALPLAVYGAVKALYDGLEFKDGDGLVKWLETDIDKSGENGKKTVEEVLHEIIDGKADKTDVENFINQVVI